MRRLLLIILGVILLIALGIAVYFVFFAPKNNGSVSATPGNTQFPNGGSAQAPDASSGQESEQGTTGEQMGTHFVRITPGPVAFGTVASTTLVVSETPGDGTSTPSTVLRDETIVRYIDRASGNVYEYAVEDRGITRLSNRTIPGIVSAAWLPNATLAFVQYLTQTGTTESVETYALPADGSDGYTLERGLNQVFVAGSSTVVTLIRSTNGSIATRAKADGTGAGTLFSSPLSSLMLYPAGSSYIAATNASSEINGYAFLVQGGVFTQILGPLKGLTILPSPSGKSVLYSFLSGTAVKAGVLDIGTHIATALPVNAIPEKCAWAADERSVYCAVPRSMPSGWPDAWYQGAISFSDRIWKVDLAARVASLVVDPKVAAQTDIDAVSLTLDPKSDVVVFTNRTDGSLWLYDL